MRPSVQMHWWHPYCMSVCITNYRKSDRAFSQVIHLIAQRLNPCVPKIYFIYVSKLELLTYLRQSILLVYWYTEIRWLEVFYLHANAEDFLNYALFTIQKYLVESNNFHFFRFTWSNSFENNSKNQTCSTIVSSI